jgi:hypothetical protein
MTEIKQIIGGSWGTFWNYYVNVTLEPCENKTSSDTVCAPEDDINDFIIKREIQVSMYYEDMVLTSTNNDKPLTKYMKNDHQRIQLNTAKVNEYFLQDVTVTTDNGWIFPQKSNMSTQIFTTRFYDFYNNNNQLTDKKVIAAVSFNIFASENKYEILRYYIKIQDVLAQLGGILKVVFMFFEGILYLIYSHKHEEILIRNLYNLRSFELSNNQPEKGKNDFLTKYNIKPSKLQQIVKKSTNDDQAIKKESVLNPEMLKNVEKNESVLNTSNQLFLISQNNQFYPGKIQMVSDVAEEFPNNHEQIDKVYEIIIEKKKFSDPQKISFKLYEVAWIVFCPCTAKNDLKKKEKFFRSLVEYTKKFSDAFHIIKYMAEFDKLKQIIFDEKQLALFSLVSQPKNPLDVTPGDHRLASFNKEKVVQFELAKNYIQEMKNRRNLTVIEKKLIDLNFK